MDHILSRFPKQRTDLPPAFQRIYVAHYIQNREGGSAATSVAKRLESWMHRKIARDVAYRSSGYSTLEVGAGSLNHLPYEPGSQPYAIVEPFTELFASSPHRGRITHVYRDLNEVGRERFDRIISIAAFEHLCELPSIVANCGVLLQPGGQLRVAIPSEGTLLWTLGWRMTTGIEFWLQHKLDYGILMRHEHVNTAREIAGILGIFFTSVKRSVFGIAPALSLYQFFECSQPNTARCLSYLESGISSLPSSVDRTR